jgi:hypothetical protein
MAADPSSWLALRLGWPAQALIVVRLVQASTRAARAEGELAGLREALTRADAAPAQAHAELALARKGWLERVLEMVRRR